MTTSQIKKPSNSLSHILGRVWEEILSNNVAAPLFARLLSPQYLTSGGGVQILELPSLRALKTPDRQGSLGVREWGNCVPWDVRVHWQGALRQCRSGFSFGYRQKCCSCIKGCHDDRGSCDFLCGPEVPDMPFSLHTKTPVFLQLLSVNSVIRSVCTYFHRSFPRKYAGWNTTLSKQHWTLDTLCKWLQSHTQCSWHHLSQRLCIQVLNHLVRGMDKH